MKKKKKKKKKYSSVLDAIRPRPRIRHRAGHVLFLNFEQVYHILSETIDTGKYEPEFFF